MLHVHAILSEYQSGYAIYMYEKYKAYMCYMYMLFLVNIKVDMQYTCMRNIRPTCTI